MSRRLPGSLTLILLLLGFLYTRSAWAESNGDNSGEVLVRVSPLTLLMQNEVTIKVGEFTCQLWQYFTNSFIGTCFSWHRKLLVWTGD